MNSYSLSINGGKIMLKYIPNILTVLRFFLIPFTIYYLTQDEYIAAIIVLTISGLTDVLDGAIARKFNLITNFGKLIDPLADKITQLSILGTLVVKNIIPLWILVVVLIKEAAMVAGASFLYGKELVVSSKWYGKASTVLFYLAIVLSMIFRDLGIQNHIDLIIYYVAVTMTVFSLIMYFREFYMKGYLKKESLKLNEKVESKI